MKFFHYHKFSLFVWVQSNKVSLKVWALWKKNIDRKIKYWFEYNPTFSQNLFNPIIAYIRTYVDVKLLQDLHELAKMLFFLSFYDSPRKRGIRSFLNKPRYPGDLGHDHRLLLWIGCHARSLQLTHFLCYHLFSRFHHGCFLRGFRHFLLWSVKSDQTFSLWFFPCKYWSFIFLSTS